MNLSFLTDRYGPLPGYAWGGLGVAGILGYRWYQNRSNGVGASQAAPTVSDSGTQTTQSPGPTSGSLLTGGDLGAGDFPSASSSGVAGGTLATGGSGFSTGPTPTGYVDAYGNPISADAYAQQTQSQNAQAVLSFIETLASEGYSYNAATGELQPIGSGTASGTTLSDISTPSPPSPDVTPPPPPTPPQPINMQTASPPVHEAPTPAPVGLAARYGPSYRGTAAQNNVIKSFLASHYTGSTLTSNLRQAASDKAFASRIYDAAVRNSSAATNLAQLANSGPQL